MTQWVFTPSSEAKILPKEVLLGIRDTFRDGFGLEQGWSLEGVQIAISRSAILGLIYGDHGQVEGYAFYSAPEEPLLGMHLLWEDAICLRKHLQGIRLTSRPLLEKVCAFFPERTFGWLGGRTQNPAMMLRYSRMGKLYPFDATYGKGQGKTILGFLLEHIAEVKDSKAVLDYRTGICKRIYPEGQLGDYSVAIDRNKKYERLLLDWGFDRSAGDAVIVVTKLNSPISGQQKEAGMVTKKESKPSRHDVADRQAGTVTQKEEYDSLRQELLEHQTRRLTILNVAITICLALFAASVQFNILFLPLLALVVLYVARVQIAEAQYGVARISAYIRVMLELDNPDLNWESGSLWIRQSGSIKTDVSENKNSQDKTQKGKTTFRSRNLYPLDDIDWFLFWVGVIAILISLGQLIQYPLLMEWSQTPTDWLTWQVIALLLVNPLMIFLWLILWNQKTREYRDLATTQYDIQEGRNWIEFKENKENKIGIKNKLLGNENKDEGSAQAGEPK